MTYCIVPEAANLQDQYVHQYRTWPELHDYCRQSAAPVGRLVLRLFGLRDDSADLLSDDVCIGLQLANFAQDVRVDARKGRTYLLHFCLPNFFFHCTTAYNILRHRGVELGKRDFLGSF